jgi:hypothetical protein
MVAELGRKGKAGKEGSKRASLGRNSIYVEVIHDSTRHLIAALIG